MAKLAVALLNSLARLAVARLADEPRDSSAATMELEAAGSAVDSSAAREDDTTPASLVIEAIWLLAAADRDEMTAPASPVSAVAAPDQKAPASERMASMSSDLGTTLSWSVS